MIRPLAAIALAVFPLMVFPAACGGDDGAASNGSTSGDGGAAPGVDASASDGSIRGDGASSDANADAPVWGPLPPTPATPELWYWHHSYLSPTNASEPAHSKALIDQAVAAGYTGLAFWDSSLSYLIKPGWDPTNLKTIIAYAQSKGLKLLPYTAPYGYSNDLLQSNPNLAEGQRVIGSQFKVTAASGGNVLTPVNSFAPLANGDFQAGGAGWFNSQDACLSVDASTGHNDSTSAKLDATSGNCRITHTLTVTPWRMYHVQFWVKSSAFAHNEMDMEVLDFTNPNDALVRITEPVGLQSTQDFKQVDFMFDSRESTQVSLYLGVWGGFSGTLWVDDIAVEETVLVNVLRRAGTPLKIYDDNNVTYGEGTDVAMIVDPALAAHPGNYDYWHAPPTVAVPSGSKLQVGQTVRIDHYVVEPSISGDVGVCLSEPDVQSWIHDDSAAIAKLFPAGTGIFLSYDEMRHMNSCALCRSKMKDAGDLLASNVAATWQTVSTAMPGSRAYVWNDMFDPHHNAVNDYYFVEGNIAGSWAGLQPGFVIMNWNLGSLTPSLTWFSGTDPKQPHAFEQIIAGYYSSGDGAKSANDELAAAKGIPGVIGLMYTTWDEDYSQLAQYASAAKSAWAAYKASVP